MLVQGLESSRASSSLYGMGFSQCPWAILPEEKSLHLYEQIQPTAFTSFTNLKLRDYLVIIELFVEIFGTRSNSAISSKEVSSLVKSLEERDSAKR